MLKEYDQIEEILRLTSQKANAIIMGDFNAVLRESPDKKIVGHKDLRKLNKWGAILIGFTKRH